TPGEPVFVAIQCMGRYGYGYLPVVAPDDDRELVGLLSHNDVMRSYNIAITRKWESQLTQNQIRLNNLIDEQVLQLEVPHTARIAGKMIKEVNWTPEAIVVSIRRGSKIIHPHGDTVLNGGDILTIVVDPDHQGILESIINAPRPDDSTELDR
ncbi:MAG TPA: TrkA C-terminal domain-containing protein, partial [Aggregatilineales bacterium]|nr:TrkA C-terminal domain-containing protein [Aggregatilineales bacterium]